jgi:ribokinase
MSASVIDNGNLPKRGATTGPTASVVVVGTFAVGVTFRTERLPSLGETLHGSGLAIGYGGKGSNQAVASARLGARVELVTCVGEDAFGPWARALYEKEGVGTSGIATSARLPTGLGAILVTPDGRNAIIVDIGANREMDGAFVDKRASIIQNASTLLTVTEAPLPAVTRAIEIAHARGMTVVLNPAPAVALEPGLLAKVTVLTPNASELATLTGMETGSADSAEAAARSLLRQGAKSVVVTLGENGALVCTGGGTLRVPAPRVKVKDTTGAGDAFSAGLAVALSEGQSLEEAARFAVCCGSLACTVDEVIPSLPSRAAVERIRATLQEARPTG